MEYILEQYGILGAFFIGGIWYLRYSIMTSSEKQLNEILELEKFQYSQLVEHLKHDLNIKAEFNKIRFTSIYERKFSVLLDLYSKLQEYEFYLGKISNDFINNKSENHLELYETSEEKKDSLLLFFYKNSALFEQNLISTFQEYKIKIINVYSNTHRNILNGSIKNSALAHIDLEINSGELSRLIKEEIKIILRNC